MQLWSHLNSFDYTICGVVNMHVAPVYSGGSNLVEEIPLDPTRLKVVHKIIFCWVQLKEIALPRSVII